MPLIYVDVLHVNCKLNPHTTVIAASDIIKKNLYVEVISNDSIDDEFVDHEVSSVIEGSFDAGYFLFVRLEMLALFFRVLFFNQGYLLLLQQQMILLHAKIYQRREPSISIFSSQNQGSGVSPQSEQAIKQLVQLQNQAFTPDQVSFSVLQSSSPSTILMLWVASPRLRKKKRKKNSQVFPREGKRKPLPNPEFEIENQSTISLGNLKMVEQDEVMQVFEVSSLLERSEDVVEAAKDVILESISSLKTAIRENVP
ncbi:unnamed protein product [Ilex paraguariensis]|uniref:Uncharacterized protein n=1 Tax=Ilex paraguariensis TaxID=185542 RepID=A0ABC8QPP9_9AQUA